MDERDLIMMNKESEVEIAHAPQIISFAHIDNDTRDLYTYYFRINNGIIKPHSIDVWRKNGKTGNTYKHEEIYHHEYKKKVLNITTGEFESPVIPEHLWKCARLYFIGFITGNI